MKKLTLTVLLLWSLVSFSQSTITIDTTIDSNKDTTIKISTSEIKALTITYPQLSTVIYQKKYVATTTTPPVVTPPVITPPTTRPAMIPASKVKVFGSDFSNGFNSFQLVDAGGGKMVPAQTYRGVIADDPFQAGNKVFKASVLKGDAANSGGYKSELTLGDGILSDNGDMWYSYRVDHLVLGTGGGGHAIQWHPNNGTGSATLSLYESNGQFQVVRSLGGSNYYQNGTLKNINLNQWYNLVWHVKWSTGSDGIIELYIDGVKYYAYAGQTMDAVGVFLKFGMNRWSNTGGSPTSDWIIDYDDLSIYR